MSTTFTDFLREQAAQRKTEMAEREAVIAEWTESLRQLYAQIRGWLQESDPDGILSVKDDFILHRFRGEDGDLWLIDDQKNAPRVLNREAFEAAPMSYPR